MVAKAKVTFLPSGRTIEVAPGTTLYKAAVEAGVELNSICGGKGKCGKCRAQVHGKYELDHLHPLSREELESGSFLACSTRVRGDVRVFIPDTSTAGKGQILTSCAATCRRPDPPVQKAVLELPRPTLNDNLADLERMLRGLRVKRLGEPHLDMAVLQELPVTVRKKDWRVTASFIRCGGCSRMVRVEPGDTTEMNHGLAVDIGTTTVVVQLLNLLDGRTIRTAAAYNRQISCGEDVISRIDYAAENGPGTLRRLVLETINMLIADVCVEVPPREVTSACVAGNTTMVHLFLGLDPTNIKLDPYIPVTNSPPPLTARATGLGLHPESPVIIVPGRSGYVGGDITADVIASGMHRRRELALLIDVGTNGEVVLGNDQWLVGCSCSAGPAFEGGEVRFGMRAAEGAIERVNVGKRFWLNFCTIGGTKARGICGSGLIDLISGLFTRGALDKAGRFRDALPGRIRPGTEGREFVVASGSETASGSPIVLTEADIKNIIRTKSSLYAAASVLVNSLGQRMEDVQKVYICGGFGNYLNIDKAVSIGLLPDLPRKRFRFMGNGALAGAALCVLSRRSAAEAAKVAAKMTYMELSVNASFMGEFTSALFLPHTDERLFPSVGRHPPGYDETKHDRSE
ncbi:MAG: DUF4445 domain-containing protein [Euryarchaeota archaeon]|nr:DUF4445 domain-containing protein [Euryarchaeota archaeon]